MTVLQMVGALLAVPVGIGSAYSMYQANFSPEATCKSLRVNIVRMLDKNVDAGTRHMLVRRDVEAFEHTCGTVDPDATAAFKALLAAEKAPAPAVDGGRAAEPSRSRRPWCARPSRRRPSSRKPPAARAVAACRSAAGPARDAAVGRGLGRGGAQRLGRVMNATAAPAAAPATPPRRRRRLLAPRTARRIAVPPAPPAPPHWPRRLCRRRPSVAAAARAAGRSGSPGAAGGDSGNGAAPTRGRARGLGELVAQIPFVGKSIADRVAR